MSTDDLRDRIQRFILPDHHLTARDGMGKVQCACSGEWLWWSDYYAHVTDLLLEATREACAQAWENGWGARHVDMATAKRPTPNPWREADHG